MYYTAGTSPSVALPVEPLTDLKAQVQHWIELERQERNTIVGQVEDEALIFTVFFGAWDIRGYAELDKDHARSAVESSIKSLFEQLERSFVPKIVLPRTPDPTFLPRWRTERTGPSAIDTHGEVQNTAVLLVQLWNDYIEQTAERWTKGDIYVPDPNGWMLKHIRANQSYHSGIIDATGAGKKTPVFEEVKAPYTSLPVSENGACVW
ncbi:slightly ste11-like protein [Cryomyces antarcticus]|uniref:Slightly ste11-like protein n=1 Tax=Cryomyces antarcticus TaxID=329879 RepID=A0ABR0LK69_9PEZI|nr:hypothetical protein LTR04_005454 [Oleoguttula sp. CCFEE 6159]KAK5188163.1 slightly ste11-like protein [Cryomyces antarcticus]